MLPFGLGADEDPEDAVAAFCMVRGGERKREREREREKEREREEEGDRETRERHATCTGVVS